MLFPVMKLGLAGDTMLGRLVAERLSERPPESIFDRELVEIAHEADLFVLNLECCISDRGNPWPDPAKPFFFRAPPPAVEALAYLGVDCVTLANNHALDFGQQALLDTIAHLDGAGISWVGAGPDLERARAPQVLEAGGLRLAVIGLTDHPPDYAATRDEPGVAYASLAEGLPDWLVQAIQTCKADATLVTPHWGPNMVARPVPHVRRAAAALVAAGATLVAGHSAHVFHGVWESVLFDLGDFVDDYATDRMLRNDLGLLFLVDIRGGRPCSIEAVPLKLDYCRTRLARGDDADWIEKRFRRACAQLGSEVRHEQGRLVIELQRRPPSENE